MLRRKLGMLKDECKIHYDGYGLKVLFNYGIRRFIALHHYAGLARAAVGDRAKVARKNASRDAHAFAARCGLTWRIPFSYLEYDVDGGKETMPFISPKSFIRFLIEKAPELLLGGSPDTVLGRQHLRIFACILETEVRPTHRLFREFHEERRLDNTFALALHGDEGRGPKKGKYKRSLNGDLYWSEHLGKQHVLRSQLP